MMENSHKPKAPKKKAELLNLKFTPEMEIGMGRKTCSMNNIASDSNQIKQKTNSSPKILIRKLKKEDVLLPLELSPCSSENLSCISGNMMVYHVKDRVSTNKVTLSTETQNMEIFPQKRPVKLAPLQLPTEVKEAQLQKIQAMKEEDYLDKQKHSLQVVRSKMIPTEHPVKSNFLVKVNLRDNAFSNLKKDFDGPRGPVAEDHSSIPRDFPMGHGNPQGLPSKLKAKRSTAHNSSINSAQTCSPHNSGKSRFRHLEKQHEQQSKCPPRASGLNTETAHHNVRRKVDNIEF